jgi:hypothetical protein
MSGRRFAHLSSSFRESEIGQDCSASVNQACANPECLPSTGSLHARRTVGVGYSQKAARLLTQCRAARNNCAEKCRECCEGARVSLHCLLSASAA